MRSLYRSGFSLIAKSVLWDCDPRHFRHKRELRNIYNRHAGKKGVILCNGPSLNLVDFDLLDRADCIIFGLNKINLLFERTNFRPDYITAINRNVLQQNQEFYKTTDIECFLSSSAPSSVFKNPRAHSIFASSFRGFSFNCDRYVCQGNTVTFVAMQLAHFMGIRELAVVGCDHNFGVVSGRNKSEIKAGDDLHHFSKDYFKDVTWDTPDIVESECSYLRAQAAYAESGGIISNCTVGGRLEIFNRRPLEDFLSV